MSTSYVIRGGEQGTLHRGFPGCSARWAWRSCTSRTLSRCYIDGDAKQIHRITLDNIAPALIAAGLATDAELEVLTRALDAFLSRSDTLVSTPRIFQVWARRPVA